MGFTTKRFATNTAIASLSVLTLLFGPNTASAQSSFYSPFHADGPAVAPSSEHDSTVEEILYMDAHDIKILGLPDEDGNRGKVMVMLSDNTVSQELAGAEQGSRIGSPSNPGGSRYGTALAAIDYDQDGDRDLYITAPGDDLGALIDVGRVHIHLNDGTGNFDPNPIYLDVPSPSAESHIGFSITGLSTPSGTQLVAVGAPDMQNYEGRVLLFEAATSTLVATLAPQGTYPSSNFGMGLTVAADATNKLAVTSVDTTGAANFTGGAVHLFDVDDQYNVPQIAYQSVLDAGLGVLGEVTKISSIVDPAHMGAGSAVRYLIGARGLAAQPSMSRNGGHSFAGAQSGGAILLDGDLNLVHDSNNEPWVSYGLMQGDACGSGVALTRNSSSGGSIGFAQTCPNAGPAFNGRTQVGPASAALYPSDFISLAFHILEPGVKYGALARLTDRDGDGNDSFAVAGRAQNVTTQLGPSTLTHYGEFDTPDNDILTNAFGRTSAANGCSFLAPGVSQPYTTVTVSGPANGQVTLTVNVSGLGIVDSQGNTVRNRKIYIMAANPLAPSQHISWSDPTGAATCTWRKTTDPLQAVLWHSADLAEGVTSYSVSFDWNINQGTPPWFTTDLTVIHGSEAGNPNPNGPGINAWEMADDVYVSCQNATGPC